MQATLNLDYKDLVLDLNSLSFILETSYRQYLADLFLAESKFKTAMMVHDRRSKLHMQTIQPLLEAAGFVEGGSYTIEEIENMLGMRWYSDLLRATDEVVEHVDEAVKNLKETSDNLHSALKQLYPQERFINFESLE